MSEICRVSRVWSNERQLCLCVRTHTPPSHLLGGDVGKILDFFNATQRHQEKFQGSRAAQRTACVWLENQIMSIWLSADSFNAKILAKFGLLRSDDQTMMRSHALASPTSPWWVVIIFPTLHIQWSTAKCTPRGYTL